MRRIVFMDQSIGCCLINGFHSNFIGFLSCFTVALGYRSVKFL